MLQALGFDKWNSVKGDGFFGGIWMAQVYQRVNAEILANNFLYTHAEITLDLGGVWIFTIAYASPTLDLKQRFA